MAARSPPQNVLLRYYYVPGTVVGLGDTTVNQTEMPVFLGLLDTPMLTYIHTYVLVVCPLTPDSSLSHWEQNGIDHIRWL